MNYFVDLSKQHSAPEASPGEQVNGLRSCCVGFEPIEPNAYGGFRPNFGALPAVD